MTKQITISISNEIFEIVPGYRRVVLVAQGFKNGPSSPQLKQLLEQEMENVRQKLTVDDPRLVAWREAFQKAGIKPNKFRPSIDALARRVLNGNSLPSISAAVDIGTILSLRHVLPCGAHSLNDVRDELVLRKATGIEQFIPFGADQAEPIAPGEVIFTDGNLVATGKWAWRQARHTIIQPTTTAFELNIDALEVIEDQALETIVADAQGLVTQFLGVETDAHRLDQSTASTVIEIK